MTLIINIVLLVIIALCTWGGFKRGLVGGIAGLLAIVIALFGGSLLSATYSGEVIPALKPFVGGIIDTPSTRDAILEDMGYEVDLIEFVDLAHSPKNLMIRAEKKRAPRRKNIPLCRELAARYGFRQTLLELVDPKG